MPAIFNQGKSLLGTWGGDSEPDRDFPRFGRLLGAGRFPVRDLLSKPYKLAEATDALQALADGVTGRPLIDMSLGVTLRMRIGVDFDNTLVCYDGVFHRAALERGLIPSDLAVRQE